ncbi:MAG: hypothetical protein ACO294_06325, partial [Methylococcales bacterium]
CGCPFGNTSYMRQISARFSSSMIAGCPRRSPEADLALSAAEQILGAEIDKAKHQDIINKASNQLG